jgi:prepilin-type N-terminal cleavage/methylation domain-containing protein/prepilin-type processing-associated H-X9-DG protein
LKIANFLTGGMAMTMHGSKRHVLQWRRGFTLIELLVVIAIIAILAAILFPVFSRVRDKARQTVCTSNMKNIGMAFQMYAQDYDGKFPTPGGQAMLGDPGAPTVCRSPRNGWVQSAGPGLGQDVGGIWPYVRMRSNNPGSNVWSCPNAIPGQGNVFSPGQNYIMNDYVRAAHPGQAFTRVRCSANIPGYFDGASDAAIQEPVRVILVYEGAQRTNGSVARNGSIYFSLGRTSAHPPIPVNNPTIYHSLGSNFIFCDGHVKWRRPNTTWTGDTNWAVQQYNPDYWTVLNDPSSEAGPPGGGSEDNWNPRIGGVVYP